MRKLMGKLLCWFGIHRWMGVRTDFNLATPTVMKCSRCNAVDVDNFD